MMFSELCQTWSAIIHNEVDIPKDQKRRLWIDIKRPSRCVVAEPYGWNDDYAISDDFPINKKFKKCDKCRDFATSFSNIVSPLFYVREDHAWKRKIREELLKKGIEIKLEEVDENVSTNEIVKLECLFVNHWGLEHVK